MGIVELRPIPFPVIRGQIAHAHGVSTGVAGREAFHSFWRMEAVMRRYTIPALALAALCGAQSYACALSISETYTDLSLTPPTTRLVVVCHGFGCQQRTAVGLSAGDLAKLT